MRNRNTPAAVSGMLTVLEFFVDEKICRCYVNRANSCGLPVSELNYAIFLRADAAGPFTFQCEMNHCVPSCERYVSAMPMVLLLFVVRREEVWHFYDTNATVFQCLRTH